MNTKQIPTALYLATLIVVAIPNAFSQSITNQDSSKKNVLIVADNDGTEMFDMLAPFFLFNATGQANVYIVAEHKTPVIVKRGLLILPHFTFKQIDSLHILADVIVVPNQSRGVKDQKKVAVSFIKKHYNGSNKILSVCDGSATVAASGLYDGKPLTTHSSDYAGLKKHFTKPAWVQGTTVTQSGNLFSTAGVANATEGALTVIKDLFGSEVMEKVMDEIHYPASEIRKDHKNLVIAGNPIHRDLEKGRIKHSERIGVLLQEGISEFNLAAVLDCYYRSFPSSLGTYTTGAKSVTSKFGLTLLPTGDIDRDRPTDIHVLMPDRFSHADKLLFDNALIVQYDVNDKRYIIDACLQRIGELYGDDYATFVKLMLDYNY